MTLNLLHILVKKILKFAMSKEEKPEHWYQQKDLAYSACFMVQNLM